MSVSSLKADFLLRGESSLWWTVCGGSTNEAWDWCVAMVSAGIGSVTGTATASCDGASGGRRLINCWRPAMMEVLLALIDALSSFN